MPATLADRASTATLTPEMLLTMTSESLAHMEKLNFLERYAMFMGKAQLIEFKLKKIMNVRYRYAERRLEHMTLGQATNLLAQRGMREEFVSFLRELTKRRNAMAHSFLVDFVALTALDTRLSQMSWEPLQRALEMVEATTHVFDFLNQHKSLFKRQRIIY